MTYDEITSILGLTIDAGAILNIVGGTLTVTETINNAGLIEINSSGVDPTLAISGNYSLQGGGGIWLRPPPSPNPAANMIIGVGASTLTNVDNTIFGSGTIGEGTGSPTGSLTLVNDVTGTIDALGGTLVLDTGHVINNSGTLAAGLVIGSASATLITHLTTTSPITGGTPTGGTLQIEPADVVDNAGLIVAAANGILDIQTDLITWTGGTAIAGTNGILLEPGGTLLVDVAELQLTGEGAVSLAGGTIAGGTISFVSANILDNVNDTISGWGTIEALTLLNEGTLDANDSSGRALTLDDVIVTNDGAIYVGETSVGILALDDGTVISGGGTFTIGTAGELDVEKGSTGPGATLDGVLVTDQGAIDIATTTPANAATLLIDDGTTITGADSGTLTTGVKGTLDVEKGSASITGPDATLHGVLVTDNGAIDIATTTPANAATLLIDDGTTITGADAGTLTTGVKGTLDVEKGSDSSPPYGATLDGVLVTNDSLIEVGADGTATTLLVDDGTQISGGDLDLDNGSTLDVEKGSAGPGATLDGVTVADTGATIEVGASSAATLLLDDGTTITGGDTGTLTIASGSTVDVEKGSTGPGATLDGVLVTDQGAIDIATTTPANAATLLIDDGTTITGGDSGTLTIGTGGTLDVEKGATGPDYGATLDGVIVTDNGAIEVGETTTATLLVDDGTTITGGDSGTLVIGSKGTLDVEKGATGPDYGATLDGVLVTDNGAIDIATTTPASAATLLVDDGTTITGGDSGTLVIGSKGTLDVEKGATGPDYGATLDGVIVTDSNATDGIDVTAAGAILTLDGGTEINSSDDGALKIGADGALDITGSGATLDGIIVTDDNITDGIDVTAGATLLVDDGTTITGGDSGTLTIGTGGTLDVEKGATGPDYGATLDGVIVTDNGAIEVGETTTATLLVDDGTTITGADSGTLTTGVKGTLDVEKGSASITGADATLHGVLVTDNGAIEVGETTTATLLVDDGTTITGGDSGTLVIGSKGTLDVEKGATGPDYGATLDGVIVTDSNATDGIDVTAAGAILTLDGGTEINSSDDGALKIGADGALDITGSGATLDGIIVTDDNITDGIDVTAGATLTLDGGTEIIGAGSGTLVVESGGTVDVEDASGATLDGVMVTDNGAIEVGETTTATLLVDDGTTITGGDSGTLTIGTGGTLDVEKGATGPDYGATLDGVIVTDNGAIEVGETTTATLLVDDGTTITGGDSGTLVIGSKGTLDVEKGATGPDYGATLDGVLVTDNGAIDIATTTPASAATLLVDDGTTITGGDSGTLVIGSKGTLDVEKGATGPDYGATLDGVIVTDSNATDGIDVTAAGAILTLDGGTEINSSDDGALKIGADGALDITGSGATLDGIIVTDDNITDGIDVAAGATLTLDGGTEINGGAPGTLMVEASGALDITGSGATLGGIIVTDDNTTDGIRVASGATLTLDGGTLVGGTQINGSGTGTLTVESGGELSITDNGATLDGVIVTDDNTSDGIDVAAGAMLTLDGGTRINGSGTGTLTVESGGELSIIGSGATLDGVIVTDDNTSDGIVVATTLKLDDVTQINGSGTGTLTVETGGELSITGFGATLDGVIVTDDNTTDGIDVASGAILTLDGGTQINGGDLDNPRGRRKATARSPLRLSHRLRLGRWRRECRSCAAARPCVARRCPPERRSRLAVTP